MSASSGIPKPLATGPMTFTVKAGSLSVSNKHHVLSVYVFKAVNKVPTAKIVIADITPPQEDISLGDQDDFMPGSPVEIHAGYSSEEAPIFSGIIVKQSIERHHKDRKIVIECKDPAVKLTTGKKEARFFELKDSEIIEEIVGGCDGLDPDTIEDTVIENKDEPRYQRRLTDWDFILGLAQDNGLLLLTEMGKLSAKKPDMSPDPVLLLEEGDTILSFKASADARDQYPAVKTATWDPANQELTEIEAADPGLADQGSYKADDLAAVTGMEAFTHPSEVLAEQEKQAQADAGLLRSRMAKIQGHVKSQGFAGVKPGDVIELKGMGERFNGKAFVAGVRHEIGHASRGWTTEIEFGLSTASPTPRHFTKADPKAIRSIVPGLQVGKVLQLEEDPKGEDRVLVKIPAIDNEDEGVWARVASLDAGENRGAFFRPEIDDEVALGFFDDDPRHPVILGMLNSSAKPAPITATDDNHEKGFVTRSELKLLFNDDTKVFTVATPNGNMFIMSDEDGGITLEDENGNTAIMNADGIAMEDANGNSVIMSSDGIALDSAKDIILTAAGDVSIEGVNVEIAASAEFKSEGGAGATLSAGGNTTIEGAMVMIN